MQFAGRAFLLIAVLFPASALAQIWPNEAGPAKDLFGTSGGQFERLRRSAPPPAPGFEPGLPGASPFAGRASIPMLDWTPPPAPEAAPRRSTPRAAPRPARSPAPARQATTPAPQPNRDWERSLAERERELEALRQRLSEDRRRFEAQRAAPAARAAQPN